MEAQDAYPQQIGIYLIERRIGRGGMGAVYLAVDPTLKRHVALKVLPPELAAHPESVARFEREATSLARIRHPNLVHIYAVGCEGGRHYIVMEYVKGISLAEILRQRGALPHAAAIRILGQVLAALDKVHAAGVVHRDLKPANIMIDEDQRAILMDFGLAKPHHDRSVTTARTIIGTPEYMAPELAEGGEADPRSDLYAVGIILFEMLTGDVPFRGNSAIATLRQHVEKGPPSVRELAPAVPPPLEAVLAKALAKSPADRHANARALAADLLAVAPTPELTALAEPGATPATALTLPMDAAEAATPPTMTPAGSGRRGPLIAAAVALAVALGVVALPRLLRDGPDPEPPGTASEIIYVVHARSSGAISGRLVTIGGEQGDVVLKTTTGTVRIPYRDVMRIEPVTGR